VHDAKHKPLTQYSAVSAITHSDLLAASLQTLLDQEETIAYCAEVEMEIVTIKSSFYDQFVGEEPKEL
jgi:hypothetical protein